jgi:hypothetical protein
MESHVGDESVIPLSLQGSSNTLKSWLYYSSNHILNLKRAFLSIPSRIELPVTPSIRNITGSFAHCLCTTAVRAFTTLSKFILVKWLDIGLSRPAA